MWGVAQSRGSQDDCGVVFSLVKAAQDARERDGRLTSSAMVMDCAKIELVVKQEKEDEE